MNRTRRWVLISLVFVAVVAVAAGTVIALRAVPDHRITFLVDSSEGDLAPVTTAVGAAVGNTGDRDSLALRRFGGACDDPGNTEELVAAGAGNTQKIKTAVGTLTPAGQPTLHSGVLAAIDDFDGRYPFRGRLTNRIIVVAQHGTDACGADRDAVTARLRERGLDLDFRFVGFGVPPEQQEGLTQLAAATGAGTPVFPQTPADLEAVLKQLTIPDAPDAAAIALPSLTPDPTAGWTAYQNAADGYELRHPPGWIAELCRLDPQSNLWIAETQDLIPDCVGSDFFFYRVWVRVNPSADVGPVEPPSPDAFTDIVVSQVTTDGGATGQRSSAVITSDNFGGQAPGSRLVTYTFDAAGKRYVLTLCVYPGQTDGDALTADFDLMVTKTLRIAGS